MRSRRPTSPHQDAVARRLALLSAELAGEPPPSPRFAPRDQLPRADQEARELARAGPPRVPVPGRHASRRRWALPDLVPETLRGRVVLGPAQLAVVAVLVAAGLAVTCWWVLRASPEPVAPPPLAPAPVALASAPALPGTASAAADTGATTGVASEDGSPTSATVTVDVAGKVRRPGIVVLDAGARVVDALEAAGGARSGVDLSTLNLARPLVDGEQVLVGLPAPTGVAAAAAPSAGATGAPLVDLNTATQVQLEALPEVGPVTALAILTWRDQHGGFTAVDELLEVDGIGDATLAQLAPYVTV